MGVLTQAGYGTVARVPTTGTCIGDVTRGRLGVQARPWRRRDALLLGVLGLAGCGTQGSSGKAPPTSSGSGQATPTATPTRPSVPSTSPSAGSASGATRAEIVREFGSVRSTFFGMDVPGVVSRLESDKVALTFDACGGPGGGGRVDHDLISLLRRLEVPATLFLNVRWIRVNASIARELAHDPLFELANHGQRHCPLTVRDRTAYGIRGTASVGEVVDEVDSATPWFVENTGAPPRWFRSGTAHVDEVGAAIARRLGQPVAGFSVNADAGATASRRAVVGALEGSRAGDIVIGHMNRPHGSTAEGMALALPKLLDRGVGFTPLTIP